MCSSRKTRQAGVRVCVRVSVSVWVRVSGWVGGWVGVCVCVQAFVRAFVYVCEHRLLLWHWVVTGVRPFSCPWLGSVGAQAQHSDSAECLRLLFSEGLSIKGYDWN